MNIELKHDSGLLRVTATGRFSIEEAERTFLEVIDDMARHHAAKVLLDGRKLSGKPEVMERFYYGKFVAQAVMNYVTSAAVSDIPAFAYVLKPPVLDPGRLGEAVARSRGMNVKMFETIEDATAGPQSKT